MIFRASLLLLLGCFATSVCAETAATYQRTESFAVQPKNWRMNVRGLEYGYLTTKIAGGTGAAGGHLVPTTAFNYYADIFLGGALFRTTPLSASGQFVPRHVTSQPLYVATAYLGHFGHLLDGFINTIGIALTGSDASTIIATPIVQFSNGQAYEGDPISITLGDQLVNWSYNWTPNGGSDGQGELTIAVGGVSSTLDLPSESAGYVCSLDSFGLFQPPFSAPDSSTSLELYEGATSYTAYSGNPPKLRVNAPKTITTSATTVTLTGTTSIQMGYKVKAVRYRVIHNGRISSPRSANGTTSWTANIHVPAGSSTIQIIARSDSGEERVVERKVIRQ